MLKLIAAALCSLALLNPALAQSKPVVTPGSTPGAPGAPVGQVAGATSAATAPTPAATACEANAVDKNGKPLTGTAKSDFIKKCMASAGRT